MEFRLLYQGELLPSGNNKTRPREKHAIRKAFHPQLRRQWNMHGGLKGHAVFLGSRILSGIQGIPPERHEEAFHAGLASIGKQWERNGYEFVPMVTDESSVRCALDILILRPEEPRLIYTQGDLDGQVKTVFDALSMPKSLEQVGGAVPDQDEKPFFCLFEDDRLISEVRVTADQLLLLPGEKDVKANDAFLVIHVKINYKYSGYIGPF